MTEKHIHLSYFEGITTQLTPEDQQLVEAAVLASDNAYAVYSEFRVGAALLLQNGAIITGNNQENAAFPSGLCAERVALFYAGANHPGVKILKIAIYADTQRFEMKSPVSPCGACRQVMAEYEFNQREEFNIFLVNRSRNVIKMKGAARLLPLLFMSSELRK
jgi:cytidine deaminase